MDVFHYVSHQLRGISLFECDIDLVQSSSGALYNDFDHNLQELLNSEENEVIQFSQCSNLDSGVKPLRCEELVPQQCVDFAVLEADVNEGILYDHLCFETELQDCVGQPRSTEYMEKVYRIVTSAWKVLVTQLKSRTVEIFQMRHRINWAGSDTIYDAWLLTNNLRRRAFSKSKFTAAYPHWEETRRRLVEEHDSPFRSSASESEEEGTQCEIKTKSLADEESEIEKGSECIPEKEPKNQCPDKDEYTADGKSHVDDKSIIKIVTFQSEDVILISSDENDE